LIVTTKSSERLFDYGARMMDPILGRFINVDPLADHPNQVDKSPYAYAWNNPIKYDDPDGRCPQCLTGFAIGFLLDVATQVVLEGKSLKDVNYKTAAVSGVAGALSGGLSSFAKLGKVGQVAAGAVIDAGESTSKQLITDGKIDGIQLASDVLMGGVGSQAKAVDNGSMKVKEKALDRAERIAAGDPASSGRAANVTNAKSSLALAKNSNTAVGTQAGNTLQEGSNKVRSLFQVSGSSVVVKPQIQITQDNTRVIIPIVNRLN
jgi:RHS repeat-associated protein